VEHDTRRRGVWTRRNTKMFRVTHRTEGNKGVQYRKQRKQKDQKKPTRKKREKEPHSFKPLFLFFSFFECVFLSAFSLEKFVVQKNTLSLFSALSLSCTPKCEVKGKHTNIHTQKKKDINAVSFLLFFFLFFFFFCLCSSCKGPPHDTSLPHPFTQQKTHIHTAHSSPLFLSSFFSK